MPRRPAQLDLALPSRGGARPGAGRKPKGPRAGVSHHGRPATCARNPVHVTLHVLEHVWNLRSQRAFRVVQAAIAGAQRPGEFTVVHFSVQGNHLHLVAEAQGSRALSEGVQGFSVRLAKGLNRMMGRRGKVLADRFHAHVLETPAEVRRTLAYVLLNFRSHMARLGKPPEAGLDPFSSAAAFDGWKPGVLAAPAQHTVTLAPQTWLLAAGWRRHGLLSPDEVPARPA
jgi:REP-associated tyrosine transposase